MLSFAVTAFEEMSPARRQGERFLDSIRAAVLHDAVDEIVVVDDGSADWNYFEYLAESVNCRGKLRLYHNDHNLGVFGNKLEAKARCTNEWVITCDSDNFMEKDFIDKILEQDLNPDVWYCPSFARPDFDYRVLIGEYDLDTVLAIADIPIFGCGVNTGNQTVHRESFMEVFGHFRDHRRFDLMLPNYLGLPEDERQHELWHTAFGANDSCLYNLLWLQSGKRLNFLEGLEYDHYRSTGPDSNYNRAPAQKGLLCDKLLTILRGRDE